MAKQPHPTRIFNETSELTIAWEGYKDSVKEQSKEWTRVQYVGKDGDKKEDNLKVPLTFAGFKRYCNDEYGCVEQYFTNQDGLYDEFIGICRAIKNEIREDQIIGGMLNVYNPSITQRLNNLKEQTDNTNSHNVTLLTNDPLADE